MEVIIQTYVVCLLVNQVSMKELYSLDVLGVKDRDVLKEFKENVTRQGDGRHNVNVPWIPGMELTETNEAQSRRRLYNMERRMKNDDSSKLSIQKLLKVS